MRRFEQRAAETLVLAELLDREVELRDGTGPAIVEDVAIEPDRGREWVLTKLFCRRGTSRGGLGARLRRRGETFVVDYDDVTGLLTEGAQSAVSLLATLGSLKAADLADVIHDLSSKRRVEVAAALDDEKLADVLEELPEDDQVEIVTQLETQRAVIILEAMQPDDAADLLSELPDETAEHLLQLMQPDEAEPLRRLLSYDEKTAGGLMTTEPVILSPESTIAEALAVVRRAELTPALASAVFVCRPPLETPTGRYIGLVHIQRLLREPPAAAVGGGHRQRRGAALARRAARSGHALAGDVQPGHGAGRRRRGAPAGRGQCRRRARPHPPGRLARHRRSRGARGARGRQRPRAGRGR